MTVLLDICYFLLLSFTWYFSLRFVLRFVQGVTLSDWYVYQTPRIEVPRWLSSLDMVKFLTRTLYLSSESNFISSFVDCPRIFSYPQTEYWVWPFLTLFVRMRLDIGSGLLQCGLNIGYNWPPQVQLAPTIAPQNLAFRLLGRKGGFWFSRRICLMIWFYWVKSQQHVFIFLWLIPDFSVLGVHFHLILATPLSPTFNG